MPLINHTISSLAQGVSQVFEEGRPESYVRELVNCIPSLTRGILRRNPVHTNKPLNILEGLDDSFTYVYDRGTANEKYMLIIPRSYEGLWYVFNLEDPTQYWQGTNKYFIIPVGIKPADAFRALTLGDMTFIVNKTVKVMKSSYINDYPLSPYEDWAFYWISNTTQVATEQVVSGTNTGMRLEGYKYTLKDDNMELTIQGIKDTRPGHPPIDRITSYDIIRQFADSNIDWIAEMDNSILHSIKKKTTWEGTDSNGNLSSLAVWKTVEHATKLPAVMPKSLNGFTCRVEGIQNTDIDDYYLQYDSDLTTWTEIAEPGINKGISYRTMPHVLYALGDSSNRQFIVDEYKKLNDDDTISTESAWQDRTVGDLVTNEDPFFVGKHIENLFFYKNRFGIIAEDTISLSRINDFGGFFLETTQVLKEDGPINLRVATTDVVTLRSAVATANSLIIFADEAQFTLSSGNNPLTPYTASLSILSRYDYSETPPALAMKNSIIFTDITGGYTQVREIKLEDATRAGGLEVYSDVLTRVTPTYIPLDVNSMAVDSSLGYIFLHSLIHTNVIYVISIATEGGKRVQQAVHRWEFKQDINSIHALDDKLYILFSIGSIGVLDLEAPGDISTVTYRDITTTGDFTNYMSGLWFSNFYFRDKNGMGTKRGRYQLRTLEYSVNSESKYMTILSTKVHSMQDDQPYSCFFPWWVDDNRWDDEVRWVDVVPTYFRKYINDDKITVMGANDKTEIIFTNSTEQLDRGFELATVNVEGLYYQRSRRT